MSYNDDNYNLDFNSHIAAEMCVEWIRDWFENNGNGCKAVIGISGGKDSSVVAALCVKALGKRKSIRRAYAKRKTGRYQLC